MCLSYEYDVDIVGITKRKFRRRWAFTAALGVIAIHAVAGRDGLGLMTSRGVLTNAG